MGHLENVTPEGDLWEVEKLAARIIYLFWTKITVESHKKSLNM